MLNNIILYILLNLYLILFHIVIVLKLLKSNYTYLKNITYSCNINVSKFKWNN